LFNKQKKNKKQNNMKAITRNEIGNKILTIYKKNNQQSLAKVPVCKVFADNDLFVIVPAKSLRDNFMISTQMIYYTKKNGIDFLIAKTETELNKIINKLNN
jgi:hypothetical protein